MATMPSIVAAEIKLTAGAVFSETADFERREQGA
jgi:hypothetical protein